MREQLIFTILSAVAIGILGWLAVLARTRVRDVMDRRCVHQWLLSNTRDEPGESHVDTATLAKGARLPEDRVYRACMSEKRIYRFPKQPEQWSVWRETPQSIYAKRGVLSL
jgi:hypothetical protein